MSESEQTPLGALEGTHQLAAVMFTDVVGFSSRTQANESKTLREVRTDLTRIREIAEKHHGRVLNSMGDGLLVHFHSATDAVSCGLEFQTCMRDGFGPEKIKSPLQHRVGIHLGDMYVSESEVMGDGVNIAARLQTIAEPGGICVSQTVYDIIKNKVALKATHLGPKELKNISHSVNVYKIVVDAIEDSKLNEEVSRKAQPGISIGEKVRNWMRLALDLGCQYCKNISPVVSRARDKILPWAQSCQITLFQKGQKTAIIIGGICIVLVILIGSVILLRSGAPPLYHQELTDTQVGKALAGQQIDTGRFLFVDTQTILKRRDILGLQLQETEWSATRKTFQSRYIVTIRVRGGRERYYATLEHDGKGEVQKLSISKPF